VRVAASRRLLNVPEPAPDFLSREAAHRVIQEMRLRITDSLRLAPVLKDVTLSASLTNSGGAWLELNSPSDVNADTGIIEWLPDLDGSCHGELYVHLPGTVAGASYLGQLRCAAVAVYGQESNAYVAVNVFGGAGGAQYGRLMLQHSPMVVPFFLPQAGSAEAWVAFNPSGMRSWRVYDVAIKKL
jgi:hypothetical protein